MVMGKIRRKRIKSIANPTLQCDRAQAMRFLANMLAKHHIHKTDHKINHSGG